MRVWITKYCLTTGIEEVEGIISENNNDMIQIIREQKQGVYGTMEFAHGKGKEWHDSKKSAIIRAEQLRKKKIENLKNQIEKLENLKF